MSNSASGSGKALRLFEKAATAADLCPALVDVVLQDPTAGHAVVEVHAASVNPSDVKAALGMMPHAVWPRTPGRDFAGVVVAGPAHWLGVEVWGTGGDLGITRDGSHGRYLVLPLEALCRKPASVPMAAAATVGVPFVTAWEGLRRAGAPGSGDTVVVFGANGKVGQAVVQLASRAGARVIGVERNSEAAAGHASSLVTMLDGSLPGLGERLREAVGSEGARVAYNTVGSPYFAAALESLAIGGTQILISTIERVVPFDILAFYRRNLQLVGVDTLKIDAAECAAILRELSGYFEDGSLQPFHVEAASLLGLAQAAQAYRRVLEGTTERIVLVP